MKKNALLLLFSAILFIGYSSLISAQTFTIAHKIMTVKGTTAGETTAHSSITNDSLPNTDTAFMWRILQNSMPAQWDLQFCDPINCITNLALKVGDTANFYLRKKEEGLLKLDFVFNNTFGIGTFKVLIQSILNSSNRDTFTVNASTFNTSVTKVNNRVKELSFYPNPVKDQIFIANGKDNMRIDIYNLLGVKVKSAVIDSHTASINVSDLKNGVYFIRYIDGTATYSKQFIKSE